MKSFQQGKRMLYIHVYEKKKQPRFGNGWA